MDVVRAFDYAASLNSKLRLLLAGDGPLKAEVRKLIDGLGLTSRVKLLGRVPESDIACLLRKAHVYVSAAVVDGTSISLLQALEAGTPVLLADVGGNPEWAARVDGAVLFKSGNWQELGKLMVAETSRETPGRFDRSAVLARHADWKRNSDDIVEFCLRVTSCSGPRAI